MSAAIPNLATVQLLLMPFLTDFHLAASSHNVWRDFDVPSGVRSQCPESLWSSAGFCVAKLHGCLRVLYTVRGVDANTVHYLPVIAQLTRLGNIADLFM